MRREELEESEPFPPYPTDESDAMSAQETVQWAVILVVIIGLIIYVMMKPTPAEGQEFSMSYESKYIDYNGELLHDDPVGRLKYFQPLSQNNCLYLYSEVLWDGDSWGNSYGDEAGLYLGCYFASENTSWFVDAGAGYVWVSKLEGEEIPDIINPYVELGRSFDRNEEGASFSLSLVADGYHPTESWLQDGWFTRLRTVSMVPLGSRANLRVFLEGTHDPGVYGLDEAYIGLADLSVQFSLGENWTVAPGFKRSVLLSDVSDYRDDESSWMLTFSYSR